MNKNFLCKSITVAVAAIFVCTTSTSQASGYKLALQSRVDSSAPNEVYMASFDTYDDLFSGNIGAGSSFTQINISSPYQITGLTYDGRYRMALQTRLDGAAPNEVYLASFDTYDDLLNGNTGVGTDFTDIGVSPDYQIVGLTYDGKYRLTVQSRVDSNAPNEVYIASYDTYADLFSANSGAGSGFTQLAVSPDYRIAGMTYDGKYRMVLETRVDGSAPNEVYLASFDTYDDLFSGNTGAGTGFTQLAVSPDYQIAGFAFEPNAVPEPASLVALGGASLLFAKRRKK